MGAALGTIDEYLSKGSHTFHEYGEKMKHESQGAIEQLP